jgi:hypothetical protein
MGSPYKFDEYPYDGYADEEDTQLRGAIVSRRKGKVCDKETAPPPSSEGKEVGRGTGYFGTESGLLHCCFNALESDLNPTEALVKN